MPSNEGGNPIRSSVRLPIYMCCMKGTNLPKQSASLPNQRMAISISVSTNHRRRDSSFIAHLNNHVSDKHITQSMLREVHQCREGRRLTISHAALSLQEVHLVIEAEKRTWHALPREQYPKPLVFHDGRVAFRPTPMNTLLMFLWLPLGVPLSIFRSSIFLLLPYRISIPIGAFSGMKSRLATPQTLGTERQPHARGHLYVCNHRTLLDPIYISAALRKPVTAVTYSISPISEALSPIRTVRLTRNKEEDGRRMARLLNQGDLVVCPEGTTCREPYLLRFSPLFAELTDTVIPVALVTRVSMFYGTTAAGFKFLDPFYFLANPCPEYDVEFLGNVSTTHSIAGKSCSSHGVANHVQRKIGDALGFECTTLTRKDKYLMLAGNEGIVNTAKKTVMQNLRII